MNHWPDQPEYFKPAEDANELINLTADSELSEIMVDWTRFGKYISYVNLFACLLFFLKNQKEQATVKRNA